MSRQEIEELMNLRGWNRTQLAYNLDVTENTVARWMIGQPKPSGPAVILMRLWLAEARKEEDHAHACDAEDSIA